MRIMFLSDDSGKLQVFLDLLNNNAFMFGKHFVTSQYKMLLQDWIGPKPNLGRRGDELGKLSNFYVDSYILPGGRMSGEMSSH